MGYYNLDQQVTSSPEKDLPPSNPVAQPVQDNENNPPPTKKSNGIRIAGSRKRILLVHHYNPYGIMLYDSDFVDHWLSEVFGVKIRDVRS
jgi:hypothetical protein